MQVNLLVSELNSVKLLTERWTPPLRNAHNTPENNSNKVKKVKLSLCFKWAPRHEDVLGEWKYNSTHSSTSALDGDEWSASRPGRFTPRERVPSIHWIGGWVGPKDVLDAVVKRKIPSSRRESNPRTPIVQPVARLREKRAGFFFSPC
jgi:hypothetical protein